MEKKKIGQETSAPRTKLDRPVGLRGYAYDCTTNFSGGSTGGGGGLGGLNPPPLGCQVKIKNLMCIEKRHHNMSRPTQYVPIALCLRLSLRQ